LPFFILAFAVSSLSANAETKYPWDDPAIPILIDPYAPNDINWDKAVTDKRLLGVIHQASKGKDKDPKFVSRAAEAKKRGLLWGAYHLGRPGNPNAQADLLLAQADKTGAKFLALDIDGDDPNVFISLDDAVKFIERIYEKTHRYPATYVNLSVYKAISERFDASSVFAKTPLWIARFTPPLVLDNPRIWKDYTFWQFSSEINCKNKDPKKRVCYHQVPGTGKDMDVNVFNGNASQLRALFE
jgi:lysozyme